MRTQSKIALVTFLSISALASCGDETSKKRSNDDLSAALITVSDLGTSWTEDHRYAFDTRTAENPAPDSSSFCPAASTETADLSELAGQSGAEAEMKMGDSRTVRIQAWDNSDAQEFFDAVNAAVKTCDAVEWTDGSVGSTISFSALDGPKLGNESIHWTQITTPPSDNPQGKYGSSSRTSVVRFGSVIMLLHVHDIGLEPQASTITESEWRTIVNLAANRIADI